MTVSPCDAGLPGAEPAVPDDHVWMLLAEPTEPYYLVRLIRRDPQCRGHRSGTERAHGSRPTKAVPVT